MSRTTLQNAMRMGSLKTVRMGGTLDAAVAKGTLVGDTQQAQGDGQLRVRSYDFNGDGAADVWRYDSFDAAGKRTTASLYLSSATASGAVGYTVSDYDGDGKIDGLGRSSAKSQVWVSDADHDGKSDYQSESTLRNGEVISSHGYQDQNHDGKVDSVVSSRKATSKDVLDALPTDPRLSNVVLGGAIKDVLAHATKLSATEDANTRSLQLDVNGDGAADLTELDTLDAAGQLTGRNFYAYQPQADGTTGTLWFNDWDNDGKIDAVGASDGKTSRNFYDNNHDGKMDSEYSYLPDGSWKSVTDADGDGKADSVGTGHTVA